LQLLVLIWDNSPRPFVSIPDGLSPFESVADKDNPGLASAYNAALARAVATDCDWLVLLDQDTQVTLDYLEAVIEFANRPAVPSAADPPPIGLAYPQLRQGNRVLSPTRFPRLRARPYPHRPMLAHADRIMVLNSGSVVSVAAARAVGGFPVSYPLDALDHAFVGQLRLAGYHLHPLQVWLEHHAATTAMNLMPKRRFTSISQAEERFYADYGTRADRAWLVLRRLVRLGQVLVGHRDTPSVRSEIVAVAGSIRVIMRAGQARR
jgi:hypothetical protein